MGVHTDSGPELDVYEMLQTLQHERQLRLPLLLRFPQVVCHRMDTLQGSFDAAVERFGYGGGYRAVFPVKCNHDKALLQAMVEHGRDSLRGGMGLECVTSTRTVVRSRRPPVERRAWP